MESLFFAAFGLGLAFSVPPGAVTAEALRRGLNGGFRSALSLELGSLIGDAVWAAIALAGAAVLVQNPLARLVLGAIGVVLLARLAWQALREARQGTLPAPRAGLAGGDFVAGALLSLANPFAIAFWLGVGSAIVSAGVAEPRPADFATFFAGFMLAALLWCLIAAALVTWGRRWISSVAVRWVNLVCGLALAALALSLAFRLTQL